MTKSAKITSSKNVRNAADRTNRQILTCFHNCNINILSSNLFIHDKLEKMVLK